MFDSKPLYEKFFDRPIIIKKFDKRFSNKLKCTWKDDSYCFINTYKNKIFVKIDRHSSIAYIAVGETRKAYFSVSINTDEADDSILFSLTSNVIFFHISSFYSLKILEKLGFTYFSTPFDFGPVFTPINYSHDQHNVYEAEFHLNFRKRKGFSIFEKWEISGIDLPTTKYYSLAGICFDIVGLDTIYLQKNRRNRIETSWGIHDFIDHYKKYINLEKLKKISIMDNSFLLSKNKREITLKTVLAYQDLVRIFPMSVTNHIIYRSKFLYKLCSLFNINYSYHIGLESSIFNNRPSKYSFIELTCVIEKNSVVFNIKPAENPVDVLKMNLDTDESKLSRNFVDYTLKYPSATLLEFFIENGIIKDKTDSFGEESIIVFDMYNV